MNRTPGRFSLLFCCTFLLVLANSSYSESPDDLYQKGKASFDNNDYLSAVKYLFAYGQMSGNPGVVNGALTYAEGEIKRAIQTMKQLDPHGEVTKIVAKGKADDPSGREERTIPIVLPPQGRRQKPTLQGVGSLPSPSNPTPSPSSPAQPTPSQPRKIPTGPNGGSRVAIFTQELQSHRMRQTLKTNVDSREADGCQITSIISIGVDHSVTPSRNQRPRNGNGCSTSAV